MAKEPSPKKLAQAKLTACLVPTRALTENYKAHLAGSPCTPPTPQQLLTRLLENQVAMIESLWELLD